MKNQTASGLVGLTYDPTTLFSYPVQKEYVQLIEINQELTLLIAKFA